MIGHLVSSNYRGFINRVYHNPKILILLLILAFYCYFWKLQAISFQKSITEPETIKLTKN
jgi:uncharacterized membrane protein YwzB